MSKSDAPPETPLFEPVPVSYRRVTGRAAAGLIPRPAMVDGRVEPHAVAPDPDEPREAPEPPPSAVRSLASK